MKTAGVIGLGDMGSGLAKNLIKNGFKTYGFDLDKKRMAAFVALGGHAAASPAEVGRNAQAVYIMVMNGGQVRAVVFGENGLAETMDGGFILLTATIKPTEAVALAAELADTKISLIDSPVSGGFPGAQNGTLTMMAAGKPSDLASCKSVMEAVSGTIHHVGQDAGQGQTVKACLQTVIGALFAANFEAAALAAKAGISGEVIYRVFASSGAGCGITNSAIENIIDRKFEGTGSHIATMHKDLTISLGMAEGLGVPLHMAAGAMQIFAAGKSKYPNGDNWVCTRVIEDIIGAQLHR